MLHEAQIMLNALAGRICASPFACFDKDTAEVMG
jgi:hypothetical protein